MNPQKNPNMTKNCLMTTISILLISTIALALDGEITTDQAGENLILNASGTEITTIKIINATHNITTQQLTLYQGSDVGQIRMSSDSTLSISAPKIFSVSALESINFILSGTGKFLNIFLDDTADIIQIVNATGHRTLHIDPFGSLLSQGDVNATGRICDSTGCIPAAGGGTADEARPQWTNETSGLVKSNSSMDSGNVRIIGDLNVRGKNESSNGYTITNVGGLPQLVYRATPTEQNFTITLIGDGTYAMTAGHEAFIPSPHTVARSVSTSIRFYGNTHASETNANFNYSELGHSNGVGTLNVGAGDLKLRVIGTKTIRPHADNDHQLGTNTYRFSTLYSQTLNTGDVCFQNDICMTEHVNTDGLIDIAFVYGKPTELQRIKMGLANFNNFTEYQKSHMDDDESGSFYDESLTESDFNQYRSEVFINGKKDFTFGRTIRMTLRDVRSALDRQEALIQLLYDKGVITGQEAMSLRDDY